MLLLNRYMLNKLSYRHDGEKEETMKLIDFLKIIDKDTFIFLDFSVRGIQFETRNSVEFFMDILIFNFSYIDGNIYILDDSVL